MARSSLRANPTQSSAGTLPGAKEPRNRSRRDSSLATIGAPDDSAVVGGPSAESQGAPGSTGDPWGFLGTGRHRAEAAERRGGTGDRSSEGSGSDYDVVAQVMRRASEASGAAVGAPSRGAAAAGAQAGDPALLSRPSEATHAPSASQPNWATVALPGSVRQSQDPGGGLSAGRSRASAGRVSPGLGLSPKARSVSGTLGAGLQGFAGLIVPSEALQEGSPAVRVARSPAGRANGRAAGLSRPSSGVSWEAGAHSGAGDGAPAAVGPLLVVTSTQRAGGGSGVALGVGAARGVLGADEGAVGQVRAASTPRHTLVRGAFGGGALGAGSVARSDSAGRSPRFQGAGSGPHGGLHGPPSKGPSSAPADHAVKPAELDANERLFLKREQWAMRKSGRIAPVLPPNDLLWMIWERVDILTQQALLQRAMGRLDVPADLEDVPPEVIEEEAALLSDELQARGFLPRVARRAAMQAALAGLDDDDDDDDDDYGDHDDDEGGHEESALGARGVTRGGVAGRSIGARGEGGSESAGRATSTAAGSKPPMLRGRSTLGATLLVQRLGRAAKERRLKRAGTALPARSLAPPPANDFIAADGAVHAPTKRGRRRPKRFSTLGHFASKLVAEQRAKPVGAAQVLDLMKRA